MRVSRKYLWLSVAATVSCAFAAFAQTDTAAQAPAPVINQPTAPKLPYGVDEVLKLSRAQISEDVILNYVQNSPTVYNLRPNDIVYLKNEGVSDRVVAAMLDKRRAAAQPQSAPLVADAQPPASSPPPAPAQPPPPAQAPAPVYQDQSTLVYTQPAPVYTQPPPAPSTVYVIPYPPATYAYYGSYYPYYYRPSVSLSFGFGGGYYGHHYYGHRHWGRW